MLRQRLVLAPLLCCAVMVPGPWARAQEAAPLRVYFIGNSVTDTINYRGLAQLAETRGLPLVWGRHMIPGAPLEWIRDHPEDGFQEAPFGYYPQALRDHTWDVLVLQPFDRHLEGAGGDLACVKQLVGPALERNPQLRVYIYARWPRRPARDAAFDYPQLWQREYTGQWDGTNETRDYFQRLVQAVRRELPGAAQRVFLEPVGDVMFELDRRWKTQPMAGLTGIAPVYTDEIHLNNIGSYIVGCTFYATLWRDSPLGLPVAAYEPVADDVARVIQETVWQVVADHPWSGVEASPATPRVSPTPPAQPARPAAAKPKGPAETANEADERMNRLVVGTGEDDYQGKRTMVLNADGTGSMVVELSGMKAALFASRLEFDMVWALRQGRLEKRTIRGRPERRVNMILKTMGDRVNEEILELDEKRLLLLDQDGSTRYDWRRVR